MAKVSSCKDILMLLLYAKGADGKKCAPISGRTRVMKMVFLFEKELKRKFNTGKDISKSAFPDFTPHNFGPFSPAVFSDLEFLVEHGFVKVAQPGRPAQQEEKEEYSYWQAASCLDSDDDAGVYEEVFSLTAMGREFVQSGSLAKVNASQHKVLDEFKSRCTSVPLRALLRYVYTKYPKMTTESRIRDEILSDSL